jgi:hypothetical protein
MRRPIVSQHLEGGCLCGAVRYRADVEQARAMNCYCRDCQRATGSACASFVAVPDPSLARSGPLRAYRKPGDSGRWVERFFCGDCGSQLWSAVESMPGVLFVKLGTLDDTSGIAPSANIWAQSRGAWAPFDPALPAFDRNPTR